MTEGDKQFKKFKMGVLVIPFHKIVLIILFFTIFIVNNGYSQNIRRIISHNDLITTDSATKILQNMNIQILYTSIFFKRFTINVDSALLDTISGFSWIKGIYREIMPTVCNYNSRSMIKTINVQAQPYGSLNQYNLTGNGVKIGVWDVGYTIHDDLNDHTTVVEQPTTNCGEEYSPHARLVCGTLAGSGIMSQNNQYAGMAPLSHLYVWSIYSQGSFCGVPPYPSDEMLQGISNQEIVMSNNSFCYVPYDCPNWNKYGAGHYGEDFDKMARLYNQSIFFAAGNSRNIPVYGGLIYCGTSNYGSVTTPGTSKNVITIGAVDHYKAIWEQSGIGPCSDGRIKPDLVSLGVSVNTCYFNNGYIAWSGTSLACPAATGTGALLIERYRSLHSGNTPPAELTKNLLVNTAEDLGNPGPDYIYGFGLINAVSAINAIDNNLFYYHSTGLNTDQTYDMQIQISNPCVFKVTLVWFDKEGYITQSQHLINDLDLTLIDPNSNTHYPWTLDPVNPSYNAVQSSLNHIDNVEQVYVQAPTAGSWIIRIHGYNIPYGPQPFAIVWSDPGTSISSNSPVSMGDPIFITGPSGGVSYTWSGPNGFTSSMQNPVLSSATALDGGTYYVTVTYPGNCTATTSIIVNINPNLFGWVRYKNYETNSPLYPLNNTTVNLTVGPNALYYGLTNNQGEYSIAADPGTYTVKLDIQNPYTLPNSTDAFLAVKYAVGQYNLSSFQQHLADVNGNLCINAGDALAILKRFVGQISSFPNGVEDWYSDIYSGSNPITINSSQTYTDNFSAACMGDVDLSNYSSYLPKQSPSVRLNTSGSKYIKSGKAFDVNVIINDSMVVGAMSLIFNIPTDIYRLNGVQIPGTCDTCNIISYNDHTGDLKIAWYNLSGILRDTNDLLVNLNLTALDSSYNGSLKDITLDNMSEIADTSGRIRTNIELRIPKLILISNNNDNLELKVYPIPAMNNIEVSYTIPTSGKVILVIYDILGREVTQLINSNQEANTYNENFDVSKLSNGVYTFRFCYNDFIRTGKIVINR